MCLPRSTQREATAGVFQKFSHFFSVLFPSVAAAELCLQCDVRGVNFNHTKPAAEELTQRVEIDTPGGVLYP